MDSSKSYKRLGMLGKGSFGIVHKAEHTIYGLCAVKILVANSAEAREEIEKEVKLLRRYQHTRLVKFLGCEIEEQTNAGSIFLEFCPGSRCCNK